MAEPEKKRPITPDDVLDFHYALDGMKTLEDLTGPIGLYLITLDCPRHGKRQILWIEEPMVGSDYGRCPDCFRLGRSGEGMVIQVQRLPSTGGEHFL